MLDYQLAFEADQLGIGVASPPTEEDIDTLRQRDALHQRLRALVMRGQITEANLRAAGLIGGE